MVDEGTIRLEEGEVPEPGAGEALASVRFLSIDPGDMDTPLHAAAVPDADRATLKRPEAAARELADAVGAALCCAFAGVAP